MRTILPVLILALVAASGRTLSGNPYSVFRKYHPTERVVKEESMPLVSRAANGRMQKRWAYKWVRKFKFRRLSKSLLATLRKMAVRIDGVTYDAGAGKYMTIHLQNGREGIFSYRTKELTFEGEPAPHSSR